jgi:mono/diheme cytochrome c family protein
VFGARCAACHQVTGLGVPGVFPPLAGSEWVLGDEKVVIRILLHGIAGEIEVKGVSYNGAMPAFKSVGDEELAAVMSYIRSDWGNQAPRIVARSVAEGREATKDRTEPFKGGQDFKSAP